VQVDLWFPVTGRTLPSDHGYAMYGALARAVPKLHEADNWALLTLRGKPLGAGIISLSRSPRLGLRLPAEQIPMVLPLCGRTLEVQGHFIALGSPTVITLTPHAALSARLVTIKSFMEPDPFTEAVRRQLAELHPECAEGGIALGARKVVTVGGKKVVGFSVRVSGLSDEASLALQEQGVGGRRRMGCGVFRKSEHQLAADVRPARKEAAA
jgi:CRISPR-associated protein Cas6